MKNIETETIKREEEIDGIISDTIAVFKEMGIDMENTEFIFDGQTIH